MTMLLDISQLEHCYAGAAMPHLRVGAWQVTPHAHQLIIGPSGCGKSTLLHIIAGLLTPTRGQVCMGGIDVAALTESARDKWRAKHVGMVLQRPHLIHAVSVLQNLVLAQSFALGARRDETAALALLRRLGVEAQAQQRPHTLSQGQAQRVALARALIHRPTLILADEPTASLDDAAADASLKLLREVADEVGATLLIATHDARAKASFADAAVLDLRGAS